MSSARYGNYLDSALSLCMLLSPESAPPTTADALIYRRAHAGKLMIISRAEGKEPVLSDFFRFDSVETHPTGLFVTGIFEDNRRGHMKASLVRNTSEAEMVWWNSARGQQIDMPTYIYETTDATKPIRQFEVTQSIHDAPLHADPTTGEAARRVISVGYGILIPGKSAGPSVGSVGSHE